VRIRMRVWCYPVSCQRTGGRAKDDEVWLVKVVATTPRTFFHPSATRYYYYYYTCIKE
jgi:hypothetical protein